VTLSSSDDEDEAHRQRQSIPSVTIPSTDEDEDDHAVGEQHDDALSDSIASDVRSRRTTNAVNYRQLAALPIRRRPRDSGDEEFQPGTPTKKRPN
jgi:hypothetical protein